MSHDADDDLEYLISDDEEPDVPVGLVTTREEVVEIAQEIAAHGFMAMDIEFLSKDRYIPELALLQVAWGDVAKPSVAAIDYLSVGKSGIQPMLDIIERADIETIAHGARQDLGLLVTRFGTRAQGFCDTQLAAAFAGHGEQIGYAALVQTLLDQTVDKSSRYTNWLRRPLSSKQLRYALDDVALLPMLWAHLRAGLEARGRLEWARAESMNLARTVEPPPRPEDAYRTIKGLRSLGDVELASLCELAAWRQSVALSGNTPPSWVLSDRALLAICHKQPTSERALAQVRGVGKDKTRKYGGAILERLARAARAAPPDVPHRARYELSKRGLLLVPIISDLVEAASLRAQVNGRLVATRADIERLVLWFERGGEGVEPEIPLLTGWRREVAGQGVLSWLRGQTTIAVSSDADALALSRPPGELG